MLESGTDPESYITEYTLVYEDKKINNRRSGRTGTPWFTVSGEVFGGTRANVDNIKC